MCLATSHSHPYIYTTCAIKNQHNFTLRAFPSSTVRRSTRKINLLSRNNASLLASKEIVFANEAGSYNSLSPQCPLSNRIKFLLGSVTEEMVLLVRQAIDVIIQIAMDSAKPYYLFFLKSEHLF